MFNLELSKLHVVPTIPLSSINKEYSFQTSAPYNTYDDDHKMFNLELSKEALYSCSEGQLNLSFLF
mgnify:CR=1 FL=1